MTHTLLTEPNLTYHASGLPNRDTYPPPQRHACVRACPATSPAETISTTDVAPRCTPPVALDLAHI
jgi:hypothetical protein